MKKIIASLLLTLSFMMVLAIKNFAQTSPDALAFYPGDFDALYTMLQKEIVYPKDELKKGVSGTVYVQFTIDSLGHTTDHKIHRGASPGLDAEALRVAKKIDGFVPAKTGGKPVSSEFILPIKFVPQGEAKPKGKSKKSGKK
ncbi:MAG: energy transducer TonB [Flavobacteriales bacterium]|jgi:TonB family protein